MSRPQSALLGAALVAACAAPWARAWLEADMARHMLLQFPLLLLAGAALASSLPPRARLALAPINAHGLTGLLLCLLVSGFWMVPRALDQALLSPPVDVAKFATLLAAGGALHLSWRAAGTVIQVFFVGNWAWMTAVAGLLYQDVTTRLCNVYRLDDQVVAGRGLVALAAIVPIVVVVALARRGALGGDPAPARPTDRLSPDR